MKTNEQLIGLQAYVDGELSDEKRRRVEAALPADIDARELVEGLRRLSGLLRDHEPKAAVPWSREFYWSQIRRRIDADAAGSQATSAPAHAASTASASSALGWLRWLIPALGVATVAVVVSTRSTGPAHREFAVAAGGDDITMADVSSTVFRSESDGVTVHWIQ